MSIKDILLYDTLQTPAVFGGTSHQFGADGALVTNGIHLVDISEANYMDRTQVTLKNRPTTLNPKTGVLSKEKRSVSFAKPCSPTVNSQSFGIVFNNLRIELECHPLESGDINRLRFMAADFLLSTSADAFFNRGDLS